MRTEAVVQGIVTDISDHSLGIIINGKRRFVKWFKVLDMKLLEKMKSSLKNQDNVEVVVVTHHCYVSNKLETYVTDFRCCHSK